MSEVYRIEGVLYESLKAAAEKTGYTSDYIGQLGREGRVNTRKIGRKTYVDIVDLARYSGKQLVDGTKPRGNQAQNAYSRLEISILSEKEAEEVLKKREKAFVQATFERFEALKGRLRGVKAKIEEKIDEHERIASFWETASGAFVMAMLVTVMAVIFLAATMERRVSFERVTSGDEMLEERVVVSMDPLARSISRIFKVFGL